MLESIIDSLVHILLHKGEYLSPLFELLGNLVLEVVLGTLETLVQLIVRSVRGELGGLSIHLLEHLHEHLSPDNNLLHGFILLPNIVPLVLAKQGAIVANFAAASDANQLQRLGVVSTGCGVRHGGYLVLVRG